MFTTVRCSLPLLVLLGLPTLSHALGPYTLVPLDGFAVALDSTSATAVGSTRTPPQLPRLLTQAGLVPIPLLPDGTFGRGNGVCGPYSTGYSGTGPLSLLTHAFRWTAGQPEADDLGTADPESDDLFSAGAAVNCAGVVAGYGEEDQDSARIVPLLWQADGTMRILATFLEDGDGFAQALNETGGVTGYGETEDGTHCALWTSAEAITDCHPVPDARRSMGFDINAHNAIVGPVLLSGDNGQRGFLRHGDSATVLLEPLPGYTQSLAEGLDASGTLVVGQSFNNTAPGTPPELQCTLWDQGQPLALINYVLNLDDWQLDRCLGINAQGVILIEGRRGGVATAALAVPAPAVAAPPVVTPPPDAGHPKRHSRHNLGALLAWLEKWQARRDACEDKHGRWRQVMQKEQRS
jgi:hypothetical protein